MRDESNGSFIHPDGESEPFYGLGQVHRHVDSN